MADEIVPDEKPISAVLEIICEQLEDVLDKLPATVPTQSNKLGECITFIRIQIDRLQTTKPDSEENK